MPDATPMFPLSRPLMPGMPLPLRLFEPRYLTMLESVLVREPAEFGVVLIERGTEAGGGETRFDLGTMARVAQVAPDGDTFVLIAHGSSRFTVDRWLPDDPYPQAEIQLVPDLAWDDELDVALFAAEDAIRSDLIRASELIDLEWAPDTPLGDDPVERSWQLAGISLLGELDQLELLRATSVGQLLEQTVEASAAALELLEFRHGS
ncbi:MAG: LON peptidase substrate-binding domain-containing protein [Aeromicrobium sp.]|uniref:LON peptidase substrate-binding domain-containing protein n=1 Tax=Aeromicrobium sp. TaxID=1871063 RepID=UPI00261E2327|nr:LON peptidase substrate-binding domain-containing protein [Aeromicrobium sp.]MDF1706111.1 LON peptidase substrate-binding domain-containing protein [Aeromicrobium sp.]